MADINVKINGIAVSVPKGTTVLEAAHTAGVDIPTFCYMKEINESAPAVSAWSRSTRAAASVWSLRAYTR